MTYAVAELTILDHSNDLLQVLKNFVEQCTVETVEDEFASADKISAYVTFGDEYAQLYANSADQIILAYSNPDNLESYEFIQIEGEIATVDQILNIIPEDILQLLPE